ncbi:hypothetical protein [Heyndrickxia oleronia]
MVNGDFENGTLTPWLSTNTSIISLNTHSGYYSSLLHGGSVNSYV